MASMRPTLGLAWLPCGTLWAGFGVGPFLVAWLAVALPTHGMLLMEAVSYDSTFKER